MMVTGDPIDFYNLRLPTVDNPIYIDGFNCTIERREQRHLNPTVYYADIRFRYIILPVQKLL
jgi:hypothetical protein